MARKTSSIEQISTTPGDFNATRRKYFAIGGEVLVERNWWRLFAIVLVGAVIALAVALRGLTPLKTVETYGIKSSSDTGEVAVLAASASRYVPNEQNIKFFFAQWAKKLLTLDPVLTKQNLNDGYRMTTGKAAQQFVDWINKDDPMGQMRGDSDLTREVTVKTVSVLPDNVVMVRLDVTMRSGRSAQSAPYLITAHYEIVPPKTESDLFFNPNGLYITHFTVSNETVK